MLVKIMTVCSGLDYKGNDFKALVYEFMTNGSLDEWLHPVLSTDLTDEQPRTLNLFQRLKIATDLASALDYLHHHCQPPIAHCDLKPCNILIDEDMTAHVGDFGLARFLPDTVHKQTSSTGLRGTVGYAAPGNYLFLIHSFFFFYRKCSTMTTYKFFYKYFYNL